MSLIQLDLFEETTDMDIVNCELKQLKESQDKLRRSFFGRHHDQGKLIVQLMTRIEFLERNLSK